MSEVKVKSAREWLRWLQRGEHCKACKDLNKVGIRTGCGKHEIEDEDFL